MQVVRGLFLCLLAAGCTDTSQIFNSKERDKNPANAENVLQSNDRPQETGEGLPGYTSCRVLKEPVAADTSGSVGCRLEANGSKVQLNPEDIQWVVSSNNETSIQTTVQSPSSEWQAIFGFSGTTIALTKDAMLNSNISVTYNDFQDDFRIFESIPSDQDPIGTDQAFRIHFAPAGSLANWNLLPVPADNNGTASASFTFRSTDTVLTTISRLDNTSTTALVSTALATETNGEQPWNILAGTGISHESGLHIRIEGVPQGSYKARVFAAIPDTLASSELHLTAEVLQGGAYQRKANEYQIPIISASQSINNAHYFAWIEFEILSEADRVLDFRVIRANVDPGVVPVIIQAVVIDQY